MDTSGNDWNYQFKTFLITTASIYVGEMLIFFVALFLYHFCFFLPRVRLKMYKVPQDEASKSLLRISGMLSAEGATVDITQRDDLSTETVARRQDDPTQHEVDAVDSPFAETDGFVRKKQKRDTMAIPDTLTPPSSMRDSPGDKTLVSAKTHSTYESPAGIAKKQKETDQLERTQRSLRKPHIPSPKFHSNSEKAVPDNPPNSVVLY
ncbi:hypothetical protein Y032_0097g2973 [Ancylostoma ceylanicum]|uniref:Uncharacterized protein n=1 Tax=Ancylostoma ceylanicum TaxID=53326 RepID=A0A016TIN6_9BILA|nr:hypothetical protein Y032_0097g2973 [Ancylostoma ceylanicum]